MTLSFRPAGQRAVLVEGEAPPAAVAQAVRSVAAAAGIPLAEVVPGACTVLVVAQRAADVAALALAVASADVIVDVPPARPAEVVELAVTYDGADLTEVAAAVGCPPAQVAALHSQAHYRAEFCGFAPGFAYLVGLPEVLHRPRRDTPRTSVPAGSVAVADRYSAVYPGCSPGGWWLLGHTDAAMWDASRDPPALLRPGTEVRFRVVGWP